jgi:hypothetical protein
MINHARTLLLNVSGPRDASIYVPGDVYIPNYTALTLPSSLATIYRILFGAAPDYEGKVYRTAQYMDVLHGTEFQAYVYDLDSRITYDPNDADIFEEGLYFPIASSAQITVNGTWPEGGSSGRVLTRWRITVPTENVFFVENLSDGQTATYAAGATKYLVGSPLTFSTTLQPAPAGSRWTVINKSRPPDLGGVLATLKTLPEATLAAVFGKTEPFVTCYNMFTQNNLLPYQLSGLLLAYIYRLDDLRSN